MSFNGNTRSYVASSSSSSSKSVQQCNCNTSNAYTSNHDDLCVKPRASYRASSATMRSRSLQRCSSLRLPNRKVKGDTEDTLASFKRSKSFRLNGSNSKNNISAVSTSQQQRQAPTCTTKGTQKKMSILSKLLVRWGIKSKGKSTSSANDAMDNFQDKDLKNVQTQTLTRDTPYPSKTTTKAVAAKTNITTRTTSSAACNCNDSAASTSSQDDSLINARVNKSRVTVTKSDESSRPVSRLQNSNYCTCEDTVDNTARPARNHQYSLQTAHNGYSEFTCAKYFCEAIDPNCESCIKARIYARNCEALKKQAQQQLQNRIQQHHHQQKMYSPPCTCCTCYDYTARTVCLNSYREAIDPTCEHCVASLLLPCNRDTLINSVCCEPIVTNAKPLPYPQTVVSSKPAGKAISFHQHSSAGDSSDIINRLSSVRERISIARAAFFSSKPNLADM